MINKSPHWSLNRKPHIGDLVLAIKEDKDQEKIEWLKTSLFGQNIEKEKIKVIKQAQTNIKTKKNTKNVLTIGIPILVIYLIYKVLK